MMGVLIVGIMFLIIACLILARRTALPDLTEVSSSEEPEEHTKQKPDLSKVPTLPPIRRKHPTRREHRDPGTQSAS